MPPAKPQVGTAIVHSQQGLAVHVADDHEICGRLLDALFASGIVKKLIGSEFKLIAGMYRETRARDMTKFGEPFIERSQQELQVLTGLGRAAVQEGVRTLVKEGAVKIHARGIGQEKSIFILPYRLRPVGREGSESRLDELRGIEPPPETGDLFEARGMLQHASEACPSAPQTRATAGLGGAPQQASDARQSARGAPEHASEVCPSAPQTPAVARGRGMPQQASAAFSDRVSLLGISPPAPGGGGDAETAPAAPAELARKILEDLGIGEPTLGELVTSGAEPLVCVAAGIEAQNKPDGKRQGLIVTLVRDPARITPTSLRKARRRLQIETPAAPTVEVSEERRQDVEEIRRLVRGESGGAS